MPFTLQSLVDSAIFLAGEQGVNKDVVADILVPRVVYYVYEEAAKDEHKRRSILANSTLALVNGSVALPATVLIRCLKYAALADPADATVAKKMRWVKDWAEFIRPLDNTLGYFTVLGSTFYMARPGTSYTPGAGMTGNMTLTTVQVPDISAWAAATSLSFPGEIEDEILLALAQAIRDEWLNLYPTTKESKAA